MAADDLPAVEERKRRRSSAVVRCRILAAARVLFMRDGYRGTVLRDVAGRADVKPSVLYRHFGTKQSLYDEAILEPFIHRLDALSSAWVDHFDKTRADDDVMKMVTREVYDYMLTHRSVLDQILVGRDELPSDVIKHLRDALDRLSRELYNTVNRPMAGRRPLASGRQVDITAQVLTATVIGMSSFSWLITSNRPRDKVVEGIATHGLWGVRRLPDDRDAGAQ